MSLATQKEGLEHVRNAQRCNAGAVGGWYGWCNKNTAARMLSTADRQPQSHTRSSRRLDMSTVTYPEV